MRRNNDLRDLRFIVERSELQCPVMTFVICRLPRVSECTRPRLAPRRGALRPPRAARPAAEGGPAAGSTPRDIEPLTRRGSNEPLANLSQVANLHLGNNRENRVLASPCFWPFSLPQSSDRAEPSLDEGVQLVGLRTYFFKISGDY